MNEFFLFCSRFALSLSPTIYNKKQIMKYVRILFAVALVFMVCSAFSFKKGKGEKAVYAFGVAASFNDTVVDRKSTRLNSSHKHRSRMPSSA